MEEASMRVSFSKLVNPRFNSPEFLLFLEDVEILSKSSSQGVKEGARWVRGGTLDAS